MKNKKLILLLSGVFVASLLLGLLLTDHITVPEFSNLSDLNFTNPQLEEEVWELREAGYTEEQIELIKTL